MKNPISILTAVMVMTLFMTCTNSVKNNENITTTNDEYVVFAWNDLGMHCLNPSYDKAVILPPYNTVWGVVIKRDIYPEIITNNITVDYSILNNTYSYGKTDNFGADFGQFWDNVTDLFCTTLEQNKGLNLADPEIHNGLSGSMIAKSDHWVVDGIPVTPVDDNENWNPFQIGVITAKDTDGKMIAETRTTVPTSDEINCSRCHGTDAFSDIIDEHDDENSTNLAGMQPVLCANCHGSPALGAITRGSSGKYLSEAIHGTHASRGANCYDCHPGPQTKCSRSKAHTDADGKCTDCHGSMADVANSISSNSRIPWVNEPACTDCHSNTIAEVGTGATLYRNATGHGGLYCAVCHSSPHAMLPSTKTSDNYQSQQYQNSDKTIGSCGVCHNDSKGDDEIDEFADKHGGNNPDKPIGCHICHTSIPSANTTEWPHNFQWTAR